MQVLRLALASLVLHANSFTPTEAQKRGRDRGNNDRDRDNNDRDNRGRKRIQRKTNIASGIKAARSESRNKVRSSLRLEGIFHDTEDVTVQCGTSFQDGATFKTPNGSEAVSNLRGDGEICISDADETKLVVLGIGGQGHEGETVGIVREGSTSYTMHQGTAVGESVTTTEAGTYTDPAWSCSEMPVPVPDGRALGGHDHHHDHDHHDHDHHHHHHGDASEELDRALHSLEEERMKLRGSKNRLGRQLFYFTDDFPQTYSYEVAIHFDIDDAFVALHGDGENAGRDAIAYIDLLVSGANAIYEKEIDTHLSVAGVSRLTNYDSAGSTSAALTILENAYRESWTEGADLHHALLAANLGGGIAYVGTVCNERFGFGVSANIAGNYGGPGAQIVWDLVVFMHELGHNFGTLHTHDYSPQIDGCGTGTCGNLGIPGAGTIMSYCHLCSGGISNIAQSFGGHRIHDTDNTELWVQNEGVAAIEFSNDAKRVSETMYQHIRSRGECVDVDPSIVVPIQGCTSDPDCNDGNPCNGVETCD
mmetsp:Transcript_22411/g.33016  ORF Transcript_22411/g.33016 Transcript_22411/m.33016 type:complete len:534 (-) Transcript_22411:74-1675(-)